MIADLNKYIYEMSIDELVDYREDVYKELDITEGLIAGLDLEIRKRRFDNRKCPGTWDQQRIWYLYNLRKSKKVLVKRINRKIDDTNRRLQKLEADDLMDKIRHELKNDPERIVDRLDSKIEETMKRLQKLLNKEFKAIGANLTRKEPLSEGAFKNRSRKLFFKAAMMELDDRMLWRVSERLRELEAERTKEGI
jgi:hypothetical protein